MAKQVYKAENAFLGGLTPSSDLFGPEGTYAEARDIDPHRKIGYIMPGWAESTVAHSSASVLSGLVLDAVVDPNDTTITPDVYAIDTNAVYHVNNGAIFTNTSAWPHTFSNGEELAIYPISSTNYLWYASNTDIGKCNISATNVTFDDDYMSTSAIGAASLNDASHPILEWKTYMWIGNGRYLSKFDGQATGSASAVGQFTEQALDLPNKWEITDLFPTRNHIGICAWKKPGVDTSRTESKVFMWDGVSEDYNYSIPVQDNKIVASINTDDGIQIVTQGRESQSTLRQLTENGGEEIEHLKTVSGSAFKYWNVNHRNAIDEFHGRTLLGATSIENRIFAYGRPTRNLPISFSQPYSDRRVGGSADTGFVGLLQQNIIFASFRSNTDNYVFSKFNTTTQSGNAEWRGKYFCPGAKMRINYVQFFFDPLATGDDITPTLDVDFGTSFTLNDPRGNTNISYTNDGAIVSKKFKNVGKDCYSFRPVLKWTAGDTAFSKIIIDYDFIPE